MGRWHSRRGGLLVAGQKSQKGSVATDGLGFTRIASRRVTPALGGFSGEKSKVVSWPKRRARLPLGYLRLCLRFADSADRSQLAAGKDEKADRRAAELHAPGSMLHAEKVAYCSEAWAW